MRKFRNAFKVISQRTSYGVWGLENALEINGSG